jgi:uncharacterized protein YegP (UPF0339 family)
MTTISGIIVPKDVIRLIFQASDDPASLRECSKVCKVFREIALNENFLKRLFPDAVVPRGKTIEQWVLQNIHNEKDLLKCIEHYVSKAVAEKGILTLKITTPNDAVIQVDLGALLSHKNRIIAVLKASNDVLPARAIRSDLITFEPLDPGTQALSSGTVIIRNAHEDFNPQRLLGAIKTIHLKACVNKLLAPEPSSRALTIGIAAAVSIAAVVGWVFFSKSNNE